MSAASTTMRSAGLVNLEAISSTEHATVTIDPGRTAGAPETVRVSAHTGASTSASVIRGQEGTSARTHSSTERWVHGPTTYDYPLIVSSTSRPSSNIFEGQQIYEDDTNDLMVYDGATWAPYSAGGQVGYASASTAQTLTAAADLTGLSVTVTNPASRRLRLVGDVTFDNDNAAVNHVYLLIRKVVGGSTTTQRQAIAGVGASGGANENHTVHAEIVVSTTGAGSVVYKLRGSADLFNVKTVVTGGANFILVEDLGPA